MASKLFWGLVVVLFIQYATSAQNQKLEVVKLADGVYAAVYSEFRMDPVEGNSLIVVTDGGVIVLDSGRTPDSARAIIAEIRKLTDKPVRYVVNSHWHDDHIFGNQGYQETFPGVQFIAHRNTREDMRDKVIPSLKDYGTEYWEKMAIGFESQLAKGTRADGTPLTEQQKARLQEQAKTIRQFLPKIQELGVILPTISFDDKLTLHMGGREIQLLHLGLGNTRGDVAVYLPNEKILATGDLLVHPVPFAYGSFMAEWVETLKKLRQLDVNIILPGHGPVMRDREYLDIVISLFASLVAQVRGAAKRGLSYEETRKVVNLESFRERLAGDDPVRKGVFADSILRSAIELAYKEAKGETKVSVTGKAIQRGASHQPSEAVKL